MSGGVGLLAKTPLIWQNTHIPPTPRTTDAMLRALAVRLPDGVAVADGKTTLTFAELEARTARIAAALASLGAYGHVVVLDMPVGAELFMAFLAVTRLGAIALPLHDLLRAEEIRFIVELTQPCLGIGAASRLFGVPVYRWEDLPSPAGRRVLSPSRLRKLSPCSERLPEQRGTQSSFACPMDNSAVDCRCPPSTMPGGPDTVAL